MNEIRNHYSEEWLKWGQSEWEKFIKKEIETAEETYSNQPNRLNSDFNRENSIIDQYRGRGVFELLQNADDQVEIGKITKVLFSLTEGYLFIANTGVPFSPDGIKSLMISDISPKPLRRVNLIGNKGLGFRSVLEWASSIAIISGMMEIGFSPTTSRSWTNILSSKYESIKDMIEKNKDIEDIQTPILSCPDLLYSNNQEPYAQLKEMCKKIIATGYDTVIGIKLKSDTKTYGDINAQLEELPKETILFLNNTIELIINLDGKAKTYKIIKKEPSGNKEEKITINLNGSEEIWHVYKTDGHIPLEKTGDNEQKKQRYYEIKLARPRHEKQNNENFIFTYFPTKILFPFPIVAHVTFELTPDRQYLSMKGVNKFLASELAKAMVEFARKNVDANDLWIGLKILTPEGTIDERLSEFGFYTELLSKARISDIVPVYGGGFIAPSKALYVDVNLNNLNMAKEFRNLCVWNLEFKKYLCDHLKVTMLDKEGIAKLINDSNLKISIEERGELIYRILEGRMVSERITPELFIDDNGDKLPTDRNSIFQPAEKEHINLPSWVPQKFINSKLKDYLATKYDTNDSRILANRLKPFKVSEYNLGVLISTVVAETNKLSSKNPETEENLRKEMLGVLYQLYKQRDLANVPEKQTIRLMTRENHFESTDKLYFGKEYDNTGFLMEELYKFNQGSFIASPLKLGIDTLEINEAIQFLYWLGIASFPRVVESSSNSEFEKFVADKLKYPADFEYHSYSNSDDLLRSSISISNVKSLDGLDDIIAKSDPHAIIALVIKDSRFNNWHTEGDAGIKIIAKSQSEHRPRELTNQKIPSFILFLLQTRAWLPSSKKEKDRPCDCIRLGGIQKEFYEIIGTPRLDLNCELFKKLGLDKSDIDLALAILGVPKDIDELSWTNFYDLLFEFPRLRLDGQQSRAVYELILSKDLENPINFTSDLRNKFFSEGKLFGNLGPDKTYFLVKDLHYSDVKVIKVISDTIPLVNISTKKGAKKVEKIFGVKSLNYNSTIKIESYDLQQDSHILGQEFERCKLSVYALKVLDDKNGSCAKKIKAVDIRICKAIKGKIRIQDEEKPLEMQENDFVIGIDGNVYILKEDSFDPVLLNNVDLVHSIAEAMSILLDYDTSQDIELLLKTPPEKQEIILANLGLDANKCVSAARGRINTDIETEIEGKYIPTSPNPEIKEVLENAVGSNQQMDNHSGIKDFGTMSISKVDFVPSAPKARTKLSIKRISRKDKSAYLHQEDNGDEAVDLVKRFESEFGHRFPVDVSVAHGLNAYGADVLSFESEEAFEIFKTTKNEDLIKRFIEVKKRGSKGGWIALDQNQSTAARQYKKRYYLYKVFTENDKAYTLFVLGDPYNAEEQARRYTLEVGVNYSEKTEAYELKN